MILRPSANLTKALGGVRALAQLGSVARQEIPTPRLIDWSCLRAMAHRTSCILAVNHETNLALLVRHTQAAGLRSQLAAALQWQLHALSVQQDEITIEIAAMESAAFDKTNSRRVLGTLVDLRFMLAAHAEGLVRASPADLLALQNRLNDTPHVSLPKGRTFAKDNVRALLAPH